MMTKSLFSNRRSLRSRCNRVFPLAIASASFLWLSSSMMHSYQAQSNQEWEVYISDWGGRNNDGSRNTPYDGDGNGSELFAVADINVNGTTSKWAWAGCRHDCYDDTKPINHPQGWNQLYNRLHGMRIFQGRTSGRAPRIGVNLTIWENDHDWPNWVANPEANGFTDEFADVSESVADVGESVAVYVPAPYGTYVQAGATSVRAMTSLIRQIRHNPDDMLWSFSHQFVGEGTHCDQFPVPGHQSTHTMCITVNRVR